MKYRLVQPYCIHGFIAFPLHKYTQFLAGDKRPISDWLSGPSNSDVSLQHHGGLAGYVHSAVVTERNLQVAAPGGALTG